MQFAYIAAEMAAQLKMRVWTRLKLDPGPRWALSLVQASVVFPP